MASHLTKYRSLLEIILRRQVATRGFSLIEVIVVMVIIAALVLIAYPVYDKVKTSAKNTRAVAELRDIEKAVNAYAIDNGGRYPASLADLNLALTDPWGHSYVYTNFASGGVPRMGPIGTDPLNTDFDLYSLGEDGDTDLTDLNETPSKDDIVRAQNGIYVGLGKDF